MLTVAEYIKRPFVTGLKDATRRLYCFSGIGLPDHDCGVAWRGALMGWSLPPQPPQLAKRHRLAQGTFRGLDWLRASCRYDPVPEKVRLNEWVVKSASPTTVPWPTAPLNRPVPPVIT